MPNVAMLDIEELRKTKLRPLHRQVPRAPRARPGFQAMMGHNIDLCEAMFVVWDSF